jgi:hypothetical protein
MAKELPFFKFNVSEWLTGDISFEPYDVQGLFIRVCCEYWNRNNKLTIKEAKKRTRTTTEIDDLITKGFISRKFNDISIKFLDEERTNIEAKSLKLSIAGRKGGLKQAKGRLKHKEEEVEIEIETDEEEEKKEIRKPVQHWNQDLPTGL